MTPKMLQMQTEMMRSVRIPTQTPEQEVPAEQFNGLYVYGAVTLLQLKPYAKCRGRESLAGAIRDVGLVRRSDAWVRLTAVS
jgi:hypothetical protein